jgi:hypothetical protein
MVHSGRGTCLVQTLDGKEELPVPISVLTGRLLLFMEMISENCQIFNSVNILILCQYTEVNGLYYILNILQNKFLMHLI